MRPSLIVTLVVTLIAASVAPAPAVGTFDGIYLMTVTPGSPGVEPLHLYVTLSQDGGAIALINLNLDGSWTFGLGTIVGSNASGLYHDHEGTAFGTFALILGTGTFSGSAVIDGAAYSLTGVKVF